jgi:tetratricopeptide (TPR) repeat protein
VSKKHKHHYWQSPKPADLRSRVDVAVEEGRFQQALELTKQIFKENPSPDHRALLHKVYMGRARQLRQQGATRDALTVLFAARQPQGLTPEWKRQIAEEMAACGDAQGALRLAAEASGGEADPKLMGQAVDAAFQQDKAGRVLLPESLRSDFDRVLTAFHQMEAAQDEAMRETLQPIGLRSPFLEWKLALRGLQAYYQNDDARALENWQRLAHDRLPARLIAPFRFSIDKAYQASQPHATQATLQRALARLEGKGVPQMLRDLRTSMSRGRSLHEAFRQAETLAASLRQEVPQLLPRLASCMYWSVLMHGQPEDVQRYQRAFGSPPDDPGLHRLQALGWERSGVFDQAHRHWQLFEKEVAAHPEAWPGDQATRVRALVWQHMGKNAASVPDIDKLPQLPPFLRDHPDRPRPLKPTAEECFTRSLQLAPDLLESHEELFHYYRRKGDDAKAIQAARDLLARSPDHVETLTELGDLLLKKQNYEEALVVFRQALKNNPLDRRLRSRVSTAHLYGARAHAEAGRFAEARSEYQASLTLSEEDTSSVLCKWAACEFKAGDTARGEELLQQALAQADNELAVTYSMLIEVIRLKLHGSYKTRFNKGFNEGLAAPATGAAAAALAATTASHHAAGVTYYGQKTHQKKVLDYLKKATTVSFTEQELERICNALLTLESSRLLHTYTALGERLFKTNPMFPYLAAVHDMERGPGSFAPWPVRQRLERAEKLARELPPDRKNEELLEQIHLRLRAVEVFNPFGRLFGDFFDPFGFDGEEEDEDDFDAGW